MVQWAYLRVSCPLTEAITSVVPHKNINAHLNVVVEPITLILEVLCVTGVRVAKYHCWVGVRLVKSFGI